MIRRSGRLLEQQKSQEPVGPVTRSKKGQAHPFITNKADDEDLSEDSEDNYNSEKTFRDTNDYAISFEPESEECIYELTNDEEITEPSTIADTLQDLIWKKSMDDEMKALHDKETWEVVTPPSNVNIFSCKWVYTCKRDSTGRVIQAKSRPVAQGFTQTFGVDYYETYSPVVHLTSLRLLCAIAAHNNWPIHQMDVNTAYLNAKLQNLSICASHLVLCKGTMIKFFFSRNAYMASSSQVENGTNV